MSQSVMDALADRAQLREALIEFELLIVHGLISGGTENSRLAVESWDMLNAGPELCG